MPPALYSGIHNLGPVRLYRSIPVPDWGTLIFGIGQSSIPAFDKIAQGTSPEGRPI
jgi:hypothetical protein